MKNILPFVKGKKKNSPFMKGGKAAGPDRPLARILSRNQIETQSAEYVTVFTDMGTKEHITVS
jgi:hypothetical protein